MKQKIWYKKDELCAPGG